MKAPHIYLVAGEASGDIIGGQLIKALKEQSPQCVLSGIGGELMAAQGLKSLFPIQDLAIMGIVEVLPHIPRILKRLKQTEEDIVKKQPDIVVTIDAKGFSFRLAKRLKKRGIPVIHYTAPTVWAWRPGRAKQIARFVDHLLVLFPFEPPYFEKIGLSTTFVGHPLIEREWYQLDTHVFRKRYNVTRNETLVCLLPGSRTREIHTLLPLFIEALKQLQKKIGKFRLVIPTFEHFKEYITQEMKQTNLKFILITDPQERYEAMASSQVALAASGTVSLELALLQTPFLIAYKVNALTAFILKRLIRIPYVCMINILLKKPLIGEFIQENCNPSLISTHMATLLNPRINANIRHELSHIRGLLSASSKKPSDLAAETIINVLKKHQPS